MPRNSVGAYSLPSGNPVVSGTTITSTWANTTMSDLGAEIQNSLDRSGRGPMLAPLKAFSGVLANPGITFADELTTGFFRKSGGSGIGIGVLGTQIGEIASTGAELRLKDGAVDTPSLSFFGASGIGFWRTGTTVGLAGAGLQVAQFSAASSGITTIGGNGSMVIQGEGGGTNAFLNLRYRNFAGDVTADNFLNVGSLVTSGFSHINFTGTTRRNLLQLDLLTTTGMTVAQLPSASAIPNGARAFVTDATSGTFAAVVVGGGSFGVPCFTAGGTWYVG